MIRFFSQLRQLSLNSFSHWLMTQMQNEILKVFWNGKIRREMVFEGECIESSTCTRRVRRKGLTY